MSLNIFWSTVSIIFTFWKQSERNLAYIHPESMWFLSTIQAKAFLLQVWSVECVLNAESQAQLRIAKSQTALEQNPQTMCIHIKD